MDPHVPVQFSAVFKRSLADVALVRPFLGVDPPVNLQVLLDAKHLMAELALERAFTGMCPVVPHKPGRNGKSFLAHIALVRVGRSGRSVEQSLGTDSTLALRYHLLLFGVRFHVTGMGTFATEVDVALFAAELGRSGRGRAGLRYGRRHESTIIGLVEVRVGCAGMLLAHL